MRLRPVVVVRAGRRTITLMRRGGCQVLLKPDRPREEDVVFLVYVLVHVQFEFAQAVERGAECVAGVGGRGVAVGQLVHTAQGVAGGVVLVFHHMDGVGNGAAAVPGQTGLARLQAADHRYLTYV